MKKLVLLLVAMLTTATINAQEAVGTSFAVNGIYYTVTDATPGSPKVNIGFKYPSTTVATQGPTAGTDGSENFTKPFTFVATPTITHNAITYDVTGFEIQAFASNIYMTSADLSALSVTTLPQQVFYGNATVGGVALVSTLTTVVFPTTLTSLGQSVFENCLALTSLPLVNLTTIGRASLRNTSLTSLDLSKITSIGRQGMQTNNYLTSVSLPAITSIGGANTTGAVTGTAITTLSIGPNLVTLVAGNFNALPALTTLNWDVVDPTLNNVLTSASFGTTSGVNNIANITLKVPTENLVAYQTSAYWSGLGFKAIEAKSVLSTNSFEESLGFSCSPNPTTGAVFVKIDSDQNAALTVYDINGRAVLNQTLTDSNSEVNLSNVSSGIYLFKVKTANGEAVKRIIKK